MAWVDAIIGLYNPESKQVDHRGASDLSQPTSHTAGQHAISPLDRGKIGNNLS
jgi:hypothetical protein